MFHQLGILQNLNLLDQDNYSDENLRAIASSGAATHIVRGNFSRAGETIRVELALQDASTLENIEPIMEEGTFNDFSIVDKLVAKLKYSFR